MNFRFTKFNILHLLLSNNMEEQTKALIKNQQNTNLFYKWKNHFIKV